MNDPALECKRPSGAAILLPEGSAQHTKRPGWGCPTQGCNIRLESAVLLYPATPRNTPDRHFISEITNPPATINAPPRSRGGVGRWPKPTQAISWATAKKNTT